MQMRGMGGESPFSCFDIIHLNIIRCVIRTPVIGQIFMLLDPFNFKFHYEIFKHSKSTGLLTWFEISQLLNSNFWFKLLLQIFSSNFWFKFLLQTFAPNFCFELLLQTFASNFCVGNSKNVAWKLNIFPFLYVSNEKPIQNIWMANQSKMIAFFPILMNVLNYCFHFNLCLTIFEYLLDR